MLMVHFTITQPACMDMFYKFYCSLCLGSCVLLKSADIKHAECLCVCACIELYTCIILLFFLLEPIINILLG